MRLERDPWLSRYREPLPIRCKGAIHVLSARRGDGRRVMVLTPAPGTEPRQARAILAEIERVHALLDHPRIPRVSASGEASAVPFLELDCDAVIDGVDMLRLLSEADGKLPYGQGDALMCAVREALLGAHRAQDPRTGRPVCLGKLSYANLFFSPTGRMVLLGFGRNFPVEREPGVLHGWVTAFQAPEVATGFPPTPAGDYVALLLMTRTLMPHADMTPTLSRLFRGEIGEADRELVQLLRWFDLRMISEAPPLRATIEEGIATSTRIRQLLGEKLDLPGLEVRLAELLRLHEEPVRVGDAPVGHRGEVLVGPEAAWIVTPRGARHRLGRALRRIVLALAEQHASGGEQALPTWGLLETGWPGEQPTPEAGANRVYVAMAGLRKMGLKDVIERFDDGYRFVPSAAIRRALGTIRGIG